MSPPGTRRHLLEAYPASGNLGSLHVSLTRELIALRDHVARESWPDVRDAGIRCLGLGYATYRIVGLETRVASRGIRLRTAIPRALDEVLRNVASTAAGPDVIAMIRQGLEDQRPELLAQLAPVLEQLESGDVDGAVFFETLVNETLRQLVPLELSQAGEAAIAAATRGLLGIVNADFNLAHQAHVSRGGELAKADLVPSLRESNEAFAVSLISAQRRVHVALASEASSPEVLPTIEALTALVERQLPLLARAQAFAYLAAAALIGQGKGTAAEQVGRAAVHAGQLTREALASYAAAFRLALALDHPNRESDVEHAISNASTLEFDSNVPDGTNVEIAALSNVDDGRFVEVRGFADRHEQGVSTVSDLTSRLELLDPSSKARVLVATVFTNLAHSGVTRGAFCRVSGTFRIASVLCEGKPAVEIDRLSQAELAKSSWLVAFLRLGRRWFQNWRNGNNMYWALGPHHIVDDGTEIDEEASDFGAGEMLLVPFTRR